MLKNSSRAWHGRIMEYFFQPTNKARALEAYVQFSTFTEAKNAMERNRKTIGSRYIELFRSNNNERRTSLIQQKQREATNPWNQQVIAAQQMPKANWGGLTLSSGNASQVPGARTVAAAPYSVEKPKPNVVTAPNDSPFPHVVGVQGLSPGIQNNE